MNPDRIRTIIFDLDGTLYVDLELGRAIHRAACRYIAQVRRSTSEQAEALVKETKVRLFAETGRKVSLSRVCAELDGDIREMHRIFCEDISPEQYLVRDERVLELLERLGASFELYLYTNNNLCLTARIMTLLGMEGQFRRVFTIEDSWRPKPDREVLERLFREIARRPDECLFVGDRYDIDLRAPEEMGAQVFLSTTVEQLLTLETMIGRDQ
jgi:putative hydrolase of the HAD superfamily